MVLGVPGNTEVSRPGERCLNKKFPVAMEFACESPILCPNFRAVFFIRWSSLVYLILQNISENSPF